MQTVAVPSPLLRSTPSSFHVVVGSRSLATLKTLSSSSFKKPRAAAASSQNFVVQTMFRAGHHTNKQSSSSTDVVSSGAAVTHMAATSTAVVTAVRDMNNNNATVSSNHVGHHHHTRHNHLLNHNANASSQQHQHRKHSKGSVVDAVQTSLSSSPTATYSNNDMLQRSSILPNNRAVTVGSGGANQSSISGGGKPKLPFTPTPPTTATNSTNKHAATTKQTATAGSASHKPQPLSQQQQPLPPPALKSSSSMAAMKHGVVLAPPLQAAKPVNTPTITSQSSQQAYFSAAPTHQPVAVALLPPPPPPVLLPVAPVASVAIAAAPPLFTASATSKSMRQKNLDYSRPLPVFWTEDAVDEQLLAKATQQMSTGIDKEEEFEYHLQQAKNKREQIPVTRTLRVPKSLLEAEYRVVHSVSDAADNNNVLAYLVLEPDICEYNADDGDVRWVNDQARVLLGIDIDKFEEYMEMFERTVTSASSSSSSSFGNGGSGGAFNMLSSSSSASAAAAANPASFNSRFHHPLVNNAAAIADGTLSAAAAGLPTQQQQQLSSASASMNFVYGQNFSADAVKRYIVENHKSEPAAIAIYDYWLEKRCRVGRSLIPRVRAERKDGLNAKDPYVAFRRRTEKIQTRKNRRNEKMAYAALLRMAPEYAMLANLLDQKMLVEQASLEEIYQERRMLATVIALKDADGMIFRDIERRFEHDFAAAMPFGGILQHPSHQQQRGTKRGGAAAGGGDYDDDFSSQNGSAVSSATTTTMSQMNNGAVGAAGNKRKKRKKLKRDALRDAIEVRPVQFAESHAVMHSPYNSFDDTSAPDGRYTFLRKAYCFYQPSELAVDDEDDDEEDRQSDNDAVALETDAAVRLSEIDAAASGTLAVLDDDSQGDSDDVADSGVGDDDVTEIATSSAYAAMSHTKRLLQLQRKRRRRRPVLRLPIMLPPPPPPPSSSLLAQSSSLSEKSTMKAFKSIVDVAVIRRGGNNGNRSLVVAQKSIEHNNNSMSNNSNDSGVLTADSNSGNSMLALSHSPRTSNQYTNEKPTSPVAAASDVPQTQPQPPEEKTNSYSTAGVGTPTSSKAAVTTATTEQVSPPPAFAAGRSAEALQQQQRSYDEDSVKMPPPLSPSSIIMPAIAAEANVPPPPLPPSSATMTPAADYDDNDDMNGINSRRSFATALESAVATATVLDNTPRNNKRSITELVAANGSNSNNSSSKRARIKVLPVPISDLHPVKVWSQPLLQPQQQEQSVTVADDADQYSANMTLPYMPVLLDGSSRRNNIDVADSSVSNGAAAAAAAAAAACYMRAHVVRRGVAFSRIATPFDPYMTQLLERCRARRANFVAAAATTPVVVNGRVQRQTSVRFCSSSTAALSPPPNEKSPSNNTADAVAILAPPTMLSNHFAAPPPPPE